MDQTRSGSGAPLRVRVASFNVRYDTSHDGPDAWPRRKRDVVRYLRDDMRPSVMGLQEPLRHQLKEIMEGLGPDFDYTGVARDDGRKKGEFNPIIYDKRLVEVRDSGTFWLSETPEKVGSKFPSSSLPRIVTWANLSLDAGRKSLYFYNTHFDHRGEEARKQSAHCLARKLIEKVGGNQTLISHPTVLTGDFNCDHKSEVFEILNRDTPLRDASRLAETKYNEFVPTFPGFSGRGGITIDFIYTYGVQVASYFVVTEMKPDGRMLSDHRPIVSDLVFM